MTGATAALESSREALSLRRYLRERAAGRTAAEWVYLNPDLRAWLAADEATATAPGRTWRRVRQPSEPWCKVLGRDLTVAADDALQALFVTYETDDLSDWRRAFLVADRNPARCLSEWRARGRRLLAAVSGEPDPETESLAGRFASRGAGKRSLAAV